MGFALIAEFFDNTSSVALTGFFAGGSPASVIDDVLLDYVGGASALG